MTWLLSTQLPPLKMNKTEVPEPGKCFHLSEMRRGRCRSHSRHPAAPLRASLCPQHVARWLGGSCSKLCSQGNFPNAAPEKPLQQRENCCLLVYSNVKYIKAYICVKVADVDLNHLLPHMDASTFREERD